MSGAVTFVGLKNCDSCKKARAWLAERGVDYDYRDVRATGSNNGLAAADLEAWMAAHGDWTRFVNKSSTTWRGLDDAAKADLDQAGAVALIVANPTLMKRPVIIVGDGGAEVRVGFMPEAWADLF